MTPLDSPTSKSLIFAPLGNPKLNLCTNLANVSSSTAIAKVIPGQPLLPAPNGVNSIEDDTIQAIVLDMFAAGTDTTYTALEWAMTELIRNPKTMKNLQNEVREVAGNKDGIVEQDLEKMSYL